MTTTSVSCKASTGQPAPLVAAAPTLNLTPQHRHWSPSTPRRIPSHGSNYKTLTPSRKPKTPCDRYVPSRSAGDLEFSRFQISTPPLKNVLKSTGNLPSGSAGKPSAQERIDANESNRKLLSMRERLLGLKGQSSENRILAFNSSPSNQQANTTPNSGGCDYWNSHTLIPTASPVGKKVTRKIPKSADKVLDAPNLINDFYLNLLDWSKQDQVSIALDSSVYVFNASKGDVHQLCDLDSTTSVTSLQWNRTGTYLAVGTSEADVQIWDVNAAKCVRKLKSHQSRVSSLSWRPKSVLLSSGSQNGKIHNYDPRMAQYHVQTLKAHRLDVCGLKWSENGRFLASGGNDNVVNVWDTYHNDPWGAPSHSFKAHTAAVKVCEPKSLVKKEVRNSNRQNLSKKSSDSLFRTLSFYPKAMCNF